jgi:hypothetical protein
VVDVLGSFAKVRERETERGSAASYIYIYIYIATARTVVDVLGSFAKVHERETERETQRGGERDTERLSRQPFFPSLSCSLAVSKRGSVVHCLLEVLLFFFLSCPAAGHLSI